MFDLESALILGLVVLGLVSQVRSVVYGDKSDRISVAACFAVSLVAVLLVAASDFAHEQVVLDRPLDSLNFWSQLVIVVLVAGIASAAWQAYKKVGNVGQNEVKAVDPNKVR